MPSFLLYALATGLAVAALAGPLGSFAVWRRMSYFGDTLAHSALIGVAFGLFLQINIALSIVLACCVIAVALVLLERRGSLSTDTLLGVLSHGALAVGLVAVSLYSETRVNLYGYLFGDFLTVTFKEVLTIYLAIAVIGACLFWLWKPLLMISTDEELAEVEGLNVTRLKLMLMLMMAVLIALAMKIVGVLLITALLIIPAATARRFTSSPEAMAAVASMLGMLAVSGGLFCSYWWDVPAGPAVVAVAVAGFMFSQLLPQKA